MLEMSCAFSQCVALGAATIVQNSELAAERELKLTTFTKEWEGSIAEDAHPNTRMVKRKGQRWLRVWIG